MIEESGYERWHLRVEIAWTVDNADIGELGLRLARQEPQDLVAQCRGWHGRVEYLEHTDVHPVEDGMPTAFGRDFEPRQAGFLGQFPQYAAVEVDLVGIDIIEIGRAADKMHPSGISRVIGHNA